MDAEWVQRARFMRNTFHVSNGYCTKKKQFHRIEVKKSNEKWQTKKNIYFLFPTIQRSVFQLYQTVSIYRRYILNFDLFLFIGIVHLGTVLCTNRSKEEKIADDSEFAKSGCDSLFTAIDIDHY